MELTAQYFIDEPPKQVALGDKGGNMSFPKTNVSRGEVCQTLL